MGSHPNISFVKFPRQGTVLYRRVWVWFDDSDPGRPIPGICIRDDREEPFLTIFKLEDGRTVTSLECTYSFEVIIQKGKENE